jgi:TRAP-type C4-dicarboxylate transport system substrate-binding protein
MMKTLRNALLAAILATAFLPPGPAVAAEYIYASYVPPKHALNALGLKPMFKELKGTVDWKLLTGGQLFGARSTLKSVGGRIADAGFVIPPYTQRELKHAFTLNDMMFAGQNPLAVNAAVLETMFFDCPECQADYKKSNTIFIAGYATMDFALMCNKKLVSVADAKGKKMRTTGAYGRWAKAIGGVPVSMTSGDMIEAIERGQIDCIVGPIAWVKRYPILDSVKYVLDYPFGTFPLVGLLVMNLDAWKAHSPAQKAAVLKASPGAIARVMIDGYMADADKARAAVRAKKGASLVKGGKDFDSVLRQHRKKDMAVVIARAKKRGVKNPRKIVDAYLGNLAKWEKIMSGTNRDSASYSKLLWEKIYVRIDPSKL